MAILGNLKAVRFRNACQLFIVAVGYGLLVLTIPHITDALEKEQREDVGLEVGSVNQSPEDVGRLPEMTFELAECYPLLIQVGTFQVLSDPSMLTPFARELTDVTARYLMKRFPDRHQLAVTTPDPPPQLDHPLQ